ncbi:MAG: DNA polymerase III subunit chi [Methylophaga sp.]|nr:DNA polymerase III subunit chi [Methylophaga sp.]
MTRVSFYVINSLSEQERQLFACRLAEKAWREGHQVFIHTENAQQSAAMDTILWEFRPESFVPHQQLEQHDEHPAPILISHQTAPPRLMDVLINLSPEQPGFFSQFERLLEIIDDNPDIKNHGRKRYQFYRDRGYHIDTHNINLQTSG